MQKAGAVGKCIGHLLGVCIISGHPINNISTKGHLCDGGGERNIDIKKS